MLSVSFEDFSIISFILLINKYDWFLPVIERCTCPLLLSLNKIISLPRLSLISWIKNYQTHSHRIELQSPLPALFWLTVRIRLASSPDFKIATPTDPVVKLHTSRNDKHKKLSSIDSKKRFIQWMNQGIASRSTLSMKWSLKMRKKSKSFGKKLKAWNRRNK
jgi:hypothetical protein